MNNEPRKLSELLSMCLQEKTAMGVNYGMCIVAHDLEYRRVITLEEMWIVEYECMKLVGETRLNPACLLRSALLQRLQGNLIDVDDLCYLIYSCWIDKLKTEGK